MNFYEIPIFIISYNRLDTLSKCVNRYVEDGYTNIIILDNASTDDELLSYLQNSPYKVFFLKNNYGQRALWECRQFDDIITQQFYVLTDPDILPVDECPSDYIYHFHEILAAHPKKTKVGFSLKIDDLPNDYPYKYNILRWESFFWENILPWRFPIYDAPIDTTFALYRPGLLNEKNFFDGIRTGYPYTARHLGWYVNADLMTSSEQAYFSSKNAISSSISENRMKQFDIEVLAKMVQKDGIDLFDIARKVGIPSYIKDNLSYASIFKIFLWLMFKKTRGLIRG